MTNKNFRFHSICTIVAVFLAFSSCARDQQLVGISIRPAKGTFFTPDPAAQIQYTAIGNFIHPPESKDITSQVTWKTDIPQLVTVTAGTVSPSGAGCGVADISASSAAGAGHSGNLVIGYATVTVNDPTNPICPGSGAVEALTVTLGGTGNGVVTSSPAGINCPAQSCAAVFKTGTTITLTETPNGSATFVGWSGCTTMTGNTCSVTLNASTDVIATFN